MTFLKIYSVSRDGALFIWSCSKKVSDIEMKDNNSMNDDSGLKTYLIFCYSVEINV